MTTYRNKKMYYLVSNLNMTKLDSAKLSQDSHIEL